MATSKCPDCKRELELKPKDGNPYRLVGMCNCSGKLLTVIETDAPDWPPPEFQDRLEPAEPPSKNKRRKK